MIIVVECYDVGESILIELSDDPEKTHYSWACLNYIVLQLALQHYNNTTLQLGQSQL